LRFWAQRNRSELEYKSVAVIINGKDTCFRSDRPKTGTPSFIKVIFARHLLIYRPTDLRSTVKTNFLFEVAYLFCGYEGKTGRAQFRLL